MAVFDKKLPKRVDLDDTEALTVLIENAQNVNGHTEYVIRVQRGPNSEKSWLICKRYSDFVALHNLIQASGVELLLPPKKIFGNMDRNFIAQRQFELQNYLISILNNPILASNFNVKKFLDPHNYVASLMESALQHVSMALRSEVNLEIVKPIPEMGWRLRKHYFLAKSKQKPKTEMLLQWVDFGPDKYLEDKEIQNALKCLMTLNHPHVEKLDYMHCSDGGCLIVRQLHHCGTLRDLIYNAKPKLQFIKKYGNTKQSKPLNVNDISFYGRQIIETLMFLQEKGIPFGHLHLGNILVLNKNIRLLDIENSILGLPSFYRPYFVQHKKINSLEAIDVHSLGHALFEMTFGYPLNEAVCDNIPPTCPSLCAVLESILSSKSCRTGMPTLQELHQHPFFSISYSNQPVKVNFKFHTSLKQSIKGAIENIEKRLQEEQRVIRYKKKLTKMQEFLASDEELCKRKDIVDNDKILNQRHLKANYTNSDDQKSSLRSDSLTSSSTIASVGATTPPLPASKPPSSTSISMSPATDSRSALLNSICAFDKSVLRHRSTAVNGSV